MSELPSTREPRGAAGVRPGAMTMAMRAASAPQAEERWLRFAIVRDARIVREATLAPDRELTVGTEGDVACAAIEGARPIAFMRDGRWTLRLDAGWKLRTGDGRAMERVRRDDGTIEIALGDDARVRVVVGEVALLVQIVDRPAVRTRAALPASVRGGLLARADWSFTSFVVGSALLHFALVVVAMETDFPVDHALIPPRFIEVIFDETPPPVDVPAHTMLANDDTRDADDGSHGDPDDSSDHRSDPTPPGPRQARRGGPSADPHPSIDHDVVAREAAAAVHLLLGAAVGAEGTALNRLIEGGAPTANAMDVIEGATRLATNEEPGELREREGTSICASCGGDDRLGRLRARPRGNGSVSEGPPVEERIVRVRVTPDTGGPIIDPVGPFDRSELMRALRAKMPAIQRCFEHEITQGNPDAGGRLVVALRVMPAGSVEGVRAVENETGSEPLAACAVRNLRTVRLRTGPEQPVDVHFPIVFRRLE